MDKLLFLGYEFLTAFVPFLAVFLMLQHTSRRRGLRTSRLHCGITVLFAIYIIAVLHVTGAGTLYDGLLYRLEIRPEQINLLPFSKEIDVAAYLQNVLLLMPFGLLVPLLWPRMDQPVYMACSGFAFSLFIELSQLLNNRRTDIDDLILNTLGALLGWAICRLFIKTRRPGLPAHPNSEWLIYIAALFAGRFLLFFEMGLAKLLYGF